VSNWVWLSHALNESTPAYSGGNGIKILPDKQINQGDSCNTTRFLMSNHIGTHVDVPKHFVDQGKTVEHYKPCEWIFSKPLLIDVPATCATIIGVDEIKSALSDLVVEDADLVLIRTGMEAHRGGQKYWTEYPGVSPELCGWLQQRFASFSVIGMDTISISSVAHREVGRKAHRAFLGNGIRIIEDMTLSPILNETCLKKVIVMPLRHENGDGAPVTVIGNVVDG